MPFPKGWNRWCIPQDAMDTESMKLTIVHNSWSLPMFRELMLPGKIAEMDYNDIMAAKNKAPLQETLIVKALFLYLMMRCAPSMRAKKGDLVDMYNDIMRDKDIVALLTKCNMTPSSRLAEFFGVKTMLLTFAMRQLHKRSYRREQLMKDTMCDETVKFTFMKHTANAFPEGTRMEMTRGELLEFVFKELMEEQASPGKMSDDQSDAMSLRTMSLADEMAMDIEIQEDADGYPMPPSDHDEDQGKTPGPIWDDADKNVIAQAVESTAGQAILKAGDQKIITKLRKKGADVSDPMKAIAAYHEDKKEQKRTELKMKQDAKAKTKNAKPKTKGAMATPKKTTLKKLEKETEIGLHYLKGGGPSDPYKEPCHGKCWFKISKTHAATPGRERVYFQGKKSKDSKYTLILEVTKTRCSMHKKDYVDMAEYIHLLIGDGNMNKEQAKAEYESALSWHV